MAAITEVNRVTALQARCVCGWKGQPRDIRVEAERDALEHERQGCGMRFSI